MIVLSGNSQEKSEEHLKVYIIYLHSRKFQNKDHLVNQHF